MHKGILRIDYHPVSQRTTQIRLVDGRKILFFYDAQGERVLKQVKDSTGRLTHQTEYLRDNKNGRVLVDRHTRFLLKPLKPIKTETAYIYGPQEGLIGFIRDGVVYDVITDHSQSVRLVVKEGNVVAAYDYLPFGQIMRSYGNDPKAHIIYRFTGQEWDEEIGRIYFIVYNIKMLNVYD